MKIENHRLVGDDVIFMPDNHGPKFVFAPDLAVIHYAVTEHAGTTASMLNGSPYSCHVTIDSTGKVIQQVPFDRVAYHAGKSQHRGRNDANSFSLGIEVSNPGPLLEQADGTFRTTYGKLWKGGVVEIRHRDPRCVWTHWAEYSSMEIDLCAEICELWRQEGLISDIAGHDEISPGRKFDPGPAFPIDWLRETIFPTRKPV